MQACFNFWAVLISSAALCEKCQALKNLLERRIIYNPLGEELYHKGKRPIFTHSWMLFLHWRSLSVEVLSVEAPPTLGSHVDCPFPSPYLLPFSCQSISPSFDWLHPATSSSFPSPLFAEWVTKHEVLLFVEIIIFKNTSGNGVATLKAQLSTGNHGTPVRLRFGEQNPDKNTFQLSPHAEESTSI